MERARREMEAHITENFGPEAVTHADILETDHCLSRLSLGLCHLYRVSLYTEGRIPVRKGNIMFAPAEAVK